LDFQASFGSCQETFAMLKFVKFGFLSMCFESLYILDFTKISSIVAKILSRKQWLDFQASFGLC
jgi:hypothetical protein